MNDDALHRFAQQLEVDSDELLQRWEGRPDRIIEDIFRIQDLDTGEIRDLELFDVQRKVVHAYFYSDAGTLNLYKGRRIGYSFITVACFLLEGLFYPNSFYPLVSRSWSQAKNRIDDIQDLIDHAKIEIPTEKENADYIELWNGSSFQAYSADADTSRGDDSARAVLMDEMAFMEDEEEAYRAMGAFLALGSNRKMVEVSTPNTQNDLFMQEHREGSPDGENGILALKQPTFKNADEIDVERPLYDQEIEPVRPDANLDFLETQRKSDPVGFGQEYLCRPIVDEYRFFDEATVREAMDKPDETGLDAPRRGNTTRVMGVDIGIEHDDTVISVMDHNGAERVQRALIVVDKDELRAANVRNPDPGNANDVAQLINYIHAQMGVDTVIMDKGGVGQTFERIIERKLGRSVIGFDFSDVEGVDDMMGDTNIALREDNVSLVDDSRLYDEMTAIVKEKKEDYSRPRYSGKDESETGKDDTAMATVLSAFPPQLSTPPATRAAHKDTAYDTAKQPAQKDRTTRAELETVDDVATGAAQVSRRNRDRNTSYSPRNSRRRTRR